MVDPPPWGLTRPIAGRTGLPTVRPAPDVRPHLLAALVRLRDAGPALDFARTIEPTAVAGLPRERRVNHLLDVAAANLQWGRHDDAVAALVQADHTAPEEGRYRPTTRQMISDLLRSARTPSAGLRPLGAAAGQAT